MLSNLVHRGLPAQRVGADTIIYEDDWWAFVKREWERPRLSRPRTVPRPEGTILGPIIPSPMRGIKVSDRHTGEYVGWTDYYAPLLEQGRPPELPPPLNDKTRRKLGLPAVNEPPKPKKNPHGPPRRVDRLPVDDSVLITAYAAADLLGLGNSQAMRLINDEWPSVKLGAVWLVPKEEILGWCNRVNPRGSQKRKPHRSGTGPRSCPQTRVEEITTRPGVLTTAESLTRRCGLYRMAISALVLKGLPAVRVSMSLLVYEDDFKRFTGLVLPKE